MNRRLPLVGLLLAVAGLAAIAPARAEDPIVIRARQGVAAPVTGGRVDHSIYDALLRKYVDEQGLVDYAAWKAADRPALDRYLSAMAAVRPDELADDDERLAYWINVYNALTLHGMLRFYPTKSIKDHVSLLWGFDFWQDVRIEVADSERSLDGIEHKILRRMGEPRIHFAIVCASIGCPRLRNEAYIGTRLDEQPSPSSAGDAGDAGKGDAAAAEPKIPGQLDAQAEAFFNDPAKFRVDRGRGTVLLSSILDWFGEDFGSTDRAKLDFAARYVRSEADRAYLMRTDLRIEYLDYDWSINDRQRR